MKRNKPVSLAKVLRKVSKQMQRGWARLIHCSNGRHRANRGCAALRDGQWRSTCRNCGAAMVRLRKREWIEDAEGE